MTANKDLRLTLRDAVNEVLGILYGLDLQYETRTDRFHTITRTLNRAMRSVSLEQEWSYYSDAIDVGAATQGTTTMQLPNKVRPRLVDDDAVRLVNDKGVPLVWAYVLPRDALHKYRHYKDLHCTITRQTVEFSRPFTEGEDGLHVIVPVMREPVPFQLPASGEEIDERILNQPIDFDFPDLVIARAAYLFAQTDPVVQPRVQQLEADYKDIMYQLVERDQRHTEAPYRNEFVLPMVGSLSLGRTNPAAHRHPHSDSRWT